VRCGCEDQTHPELLGLPESRWPPARFTPDEAAQAVEHASAFLWACDDHGWPPDWADVDGDGLIILSFGVEQPNGNVMAQVVVTFGPTEGPRSTGPRSGARRGARPSLPRR
jgi:hypothetical protein